MATLPIRLDGARRALLVKPSALGDVVHALPVAATLARRYPELRLDWLVEEEAADVVVGHPAVAETIVSGRRRWLRQLRQPAQAAGALREIRGLIGRLRRARYDAVLDLQGLLKSAIYVLAAGAPLRVGLDDAREGAGWILTHRVPTPPQPIHAVERYLALAAALDAGEPVREFAIALTPEARAVAATRLEGLPRPRVGLHPATRWPTKHWGVDAWRAVARALAAEGIGVVVTGSAGDADLVAAVVDGQPPAVRSLAGLLSVKQLAALLGRLEVVVSVDSGPMHIAGAVGTPVVALFGPTDPARTGPVGPATVLRLPLDCSPCLSRRCRIADVHRCMREIRPEAVVQAVRDRLQARGQ